MRLVVATLVVDPRHLQCCSKLGTSDKDPLKRSDVPGAAHGTVRLEKEADRVGEPARAGTLGVAAVVHVVVYDPVGAVAC
jgi:hypothetical protein